jgi:hypothetical protein
VLAAIAGRDWSGLDDAQIDDPAALPAIVITAAQGAWLGTRMLEGVVPTVKQSEPRASS